MVLRKDVYFAETEYFPHPGQEEIHYDAHRGKVLCCGRRFGKTLVGGKEVEPCAFTTNQFGDAQIGWIIGPEFKDCEKEFRVVYNTFKKLGLDTISPKFLKNVDNGNMHITTPWGFDLECRSAKNPDSLTGEGLDFVLMVEAGRLKRKVFTEYVRPALSDKRGWWLMSGVPELAADVSLLYWGWNRGQRVGQRTWRSWRMPSWENTIIFPGGRTDPEILDAEADLTEEEFDRQYKAKFVDKVGKVMKEWDDDVHLKTLEFRKDWPLYLALDYGYSNPFVILWIQVDPWNNVYVIREDRWQYKDTDEIGDEVLANPVTAAMLGHVVAMYPDPAEPDDTSILMRKWRKPARSNTGGELKERLRLIRGALKRRDKEGWPAIAFDRVHTKEIQWEMREGYRWPEHKSEVRNDSENPMDKDNHGPEALGRFMKGYFSIVGPERKSRQRKAKIAA